MLDSPWYKTWSDLALQPPCGLMAQLIAAYQQPQRHYHSLQHLSECLAHFDDARHLAVFPGEVALALWFHDAIYNVQSKNNERLSADWAVQILIASKAAQATQERVAQLIMATEHQTAPTSPDAQLLVDIDLAILGATPQRFAEYNRQVRAEYSWVPDSVYHTKRQTVLRSFLARPYIYNTDYFRARFETQARINLANCNSPEQETSLTPLHERKNM